MRRQRNRKQNQGTPPECFVHPVTSHYSST
jgi:hypothetical protein